jgi:hypothetical protein
LALRAGTPPVGFVEGAMSEAASAKRCPGCERTLPLSEFRTLHRRCKGCERADRRQPSSRQKVTEAGRRHVDVEIAPGRVLRATVHREAGRLVLATGTPAGDGALDADRVLTAPLAALPALRRALAGL